MITAVAPSILLDVYISDPVVGPASRRALEACDLAGGTVIGEAVYGELAIVTPADFGKNPN